MAPERLDHTMSCRIALTAVALIVLAVPYAGAAGPPSAFPLADGNRWILSDVEGGGRATVSVRRQPTGLVLQGLPGTDSLRVRAAGRTIEAWDPVNRRWEQLLRLGAPAGTKYVVDLGGEPLWRSLRVTVASRKAVVHDARGKTLRNCVKLTFRAPKQVADAGLEELTFAPGVGLVRSVEMTIAGPRERVLASLRLRP